MARVSITLEQMDDETRRDELQRAEERIHLLEAVVVVMEQPHRVLDVVLGAADVTDAAHRLQREFGFSDAQASLALDVQFRRMPDRERQRITVELAETRAAVVGLRRE
ncbi:MAG: gyrA [Nocardioides sp.]|nr:gyrA [Nocardioides sp.]